MMALLLNPLVEIGPARPADLRVGGVTSSGECGIECRSASNRPMVLLNIDCR